MEHQKISKLIRENLAFHNINKLSEKRLKLSLVQYHVLSIVKEYSCPSPQLIALQVGVHPSTLTQTLKRLQNKKAISILEDPTDSRKKLVGITKVGFELILNFEQHFDHLKSSPDYPHLFK